MIRIEHLTKKFGATAAVRDFSVRIAPGESVALWGSNGAGKTTIIRSVLGLHRYEGRISVGGFDAARDGKRARRLIGYVPQELSFYDDLRVTEAVRFFSRLRGLGTPDVGRVLRSVGLDGHERKRVRELSGGMKQRLALAIALLGDPPVLVLDEVTASLDACGREEFVSLLSDLTGNGRSMLFASHRVDEIGSLAKRVVMLEKGSLACECTPEEFVEGLGGGSVLHLHIPAETRVAAFDLLRLNGFDARHNGVGLLVPVPSAQKAAPLRILAEARMRVDDFEVLSGTRAAGQHNEVRS